MVQVATASEPAAAPSWLRRHRVVVAAAAAVFALALAGGMTAWVVAHRPTRAVPLSAEGYFWGDHEQAVRPDPGALDDEGDPSDVMAVAARPGHVQRFYAMALNYSSQTQTVLGLATAGPTGEPIRLLVSAHDTAHAAQGGEYRGFVRGPVTIPPHGVYTFELAVHTAGCGLWSPGRTSTYTGLDLNVEVGGTRQVEHVDFSTAYELRGLANTC